MADGVQCRQLKVLEPRDHAAEELGETFASREFHTHVLQKGSIPLEILEQVLEASRIIGIPPCGAS